MSDIIRIRRPDDWHCHFRDLWLMLAVLAYTARVFGRGVAMPNLTPPVLTASGVQAYRDRISMALKMLGLPNFTPIMSIKITNATRPEWIESAYKAGALLGKVYPVGVTTNAEDGVSDFEAPHLREVFAEMERVGMIRADHGQLPGDHINDRDREKRYLEVLARAASDFSKLKLILEHVSTKEAVDCVRSLRPGVAATITAHHLVITENDVRGGVVRPHNHCMPTAQTIEDREALIDAATSGEEKFFFGSDTAPHPRWKKESAEGSAGCFTAPVAMPLLAQVFEKAVGLGPAGLRKLELFASENGARLYGLPLNTGWLALRREPWQVPAICDGGIVPFKAGETLPWRVVEEKTNQ